MRVRTLTIPILIFVLSISGVSAQVDYLKLRAPRNQKRYRRSLSRNDRWDAGKNKTSHNLSFLLL